MNDGTVSHNRVLRVTEADDRVVAGSERVIFDLPDVPGATRWHMGGGLRFGVDGKLYVAVGNHEDSPQPFGSSHSQRLDSAFGKILRINADGTIPSDNPYFNTTGAYKPLFALGLRNPFSMDIQPGTGLIYIDDVGQGTWEEINGGSRTRQLRLAGRRRQQHRRALHEPGARLLAQRRRLLDHRRRVLQPAHRAVPVRHLRRQVLLRRFLHRADPLHQPGVAGQSSSDFASGIGNPIDLTVTPDGSLYYMARNQGTGTPKPGAGTFDKITFTGSQLPRITREPADQTVLLGTPATFSVAADGATTYQW